MHDINESPPGADPSVLNNRQKIIGPTIMSLFFLLPELCEMRDEINEKKLHDQTSTFFSAAPQPVKWQPYPVGKLTGKYVGHQVRLFKIPNDENAAREFCVFLKGKGFDSSTGPTSKTNTPSVIVDLTSSSYKYK